jgi:hypothetical protein
VADTVVLDSWLNHVKDLGFFSVTWRKSRSVLWFCFLYMTIRSRSSGSAPLSTKNYQGELSYVTGTDLLFISPICASELPVSRRQSTACSNYTHMTSSAPKMTAFDRFSSLDDHFGFGSNPSDFECFERAEMLYIMPHVSSSPAV